MVLNGRDQFRLWVVSCFPDDQILADLMHLNTNQRCTGYTYQMLPPLKIPHKIKCIKKIQVTYQFSYLQQLNTTQRCTCCTKRKLLPLCNQERTLEVKLESFWSDTPNITFSAIKRTLARTVKRILAPRSHKDKAERTFFLQTFFCKKPVHQTNMLTSVRHAWNTGICSSNTKNARRRAGYSCQIEASTTKQKKTDFEEKNQSHLNMFQQNTANILTKMTFLMTRKSRS